MNLELIEKAEIYRTTNPLPTATDELIYELITELKRYRHAMFIIGETCVEESKHHIPTDYALSKIRRNIYYHY